MKLLDIIDKKRRGGTHSADEINALIRMAGTGEAKDYQLAAWLMAVCTMGLNLDETAWLTQAMVESGRQLDFSHLKGVIVDKHSTGGVGDKTTVALVPLLAAVGEEAGVKVAKLSGRGLGFTGGTIDKLESIPGFETALSNERFADQLADIGMALSSQTADLAPADATLYALRDVTATVESIPLIAASVVSKKIAAGASVIVLDIKYGSGAFMKNREEARELAATCREVGKRLGRRISTVISGMDQPLGLAVGNSLEIQEIVDLLNGRGPKDLESLCIVLGAAAIQQAEDLAGIHNTDMSVEERLRDALNDGTALAKFQHWVVAQGGNPAFLTDAAQLPQAERIIDIKANQAGYIASLDALSIAQAAKLCGAGRVEKNAPIRLAVGVKLHKKIGDAVQIGDILAELHLDSPDVTPDEQGAIASLSAAFSFSDSPVTPPPLLDEIVV
jgi:pyrimidine-nucleoside phosphorylase